MWNLIGQNTTYTPVFALKEILAGVKSYSREDTMISGRLTVTYKIF